MVVLASPVSVWSRSVTTSAPALMKGLRGMPFSHSSCTSELNGVPDGSRPTRFQMSSLSLAMTSASEKAFDMDWTENGTSQSPTPYTSPLMSASAMPKRSVGTFSSAGM